MIKACVDNLLTFDLSFYLLFRYTQSSTENTFDINWFYE